MFNLSVMGCSDKFSVHLVRILNSSFTRVCSRCHEKNLISKIIQMKKISLQKKACLKLNFSYNFNWPNQNQPVCKIRQYILNVTWPMGIWCLVGANMDRFLCSHSSINFRRWSTIRTARRYLFGTLIFFGILFTEVIYCFEASVPNVPVACYGRNIPCRLFNDWAALSFDIVVPSICLGFFGVLTIRNVRSRVIHPTSIPSNRNQLVHERAPMRNHDRNLTRMLLFQVGIMLHFNHFCWINLSFSGFGRSSSGLTIRPVSSIRQSNIRCSEICISYGC